MIAIIISILFSAYVSYEGVVFLITYFKYKKEGISKVVPIIDVVQNQKVNGVVPVVEIVGEHGNKIRSTIKSSIFSFWNSSDYKGEKIRVIYLQSDVSSCIRDSKNERIFIYFAMMFTYGFIILALIMYS